MWGTIIDFFYTSITINSVAILTFMMAIWWVAKFVVYNRHSFFAEVKMYKYYDNYTHTVIYPSFVPANMAINVIGGINYIILLCLYNDITYPSIILFLAVSCISLFLIIVGSIAKSCE